MLLLKLWIHNQKHSDPLLFLRVSEFLSRATKIYLFSSAHGIIARKLSRGLNNYVEAASTFPSFLEKLDMMLFCYAEKVSILMDGRIQDTTDKFQFWGLAINPTFQLCQKRQAQMPIHMLTMFIIKWNAKHSNIKMYL